MFFRMFCNKNGLKKQIWLRRFVTLLPPPPFHVTVTKTTPIMVTSNTGTPSYHQTPHGVGKKSSKIKISGKTKDIYYMTVYWAC